MIPILEAWNRSDARFAQTYWPWSLLSQKKPLPESYLLGAPYAVFGNPFGQGSFGSDILEQYVETLRDPVRVHGICEEYRAAATIDFEHDQVDKDAGNKIHCPTLHLWGEGGPLDTFYGNDGGPLSIWRRWAPRAQGQAVRVGILPEENPTDTVALIRQFLCDVIACNTPRICSDCRRARHCTTTIVRLGLTAKRQPAKPRPLGPGQQCARLLTEIRLSQRRLAVSTHTKDSMKATVINENGGPEKVTFTEVDTPDPGPAQLQVAVETAGVNYLDIYQRQGAVAAPFVAGVGGAGRVIEVGSDVDAEWVGRRVGWLSGLGISPRP